MPYSLEVLVGCVFCVIAMSQIFNVVIAKDTYTGSLCIPITCSWPRVLVALALGSISYGALASAYEVIVGFWDQSKSRISTLLQHWLFRNTHTVPAKTCPCPSPLLYTDEDIWQTNTNKHIQRVICHTNQPPPSRLRNNADRLSLPRLHTVY